MLQNVATGRYLAAVENHGSFRVKTVAQAAEWAFEISDGTMLRLKLQQDENDFDLTARSSYALLKPSDLQNAAQKWLLFQDKQE